MTLNSELPEIKERFRFELCDEHTEEDQVVGMFVFKACQEHRQAHRRGNIGRVQL